MKLKKSLSLLIVLVITTLSVSIIGYADNKTSDSHNNIEIYISNNELSDELKQRVYSHFNSSSVQKDPSDSKGITCTLFGHKLEYSTVTTITHKVRSTSPRCLREIYAYEACTRCDYENYTLTSSKYIVCCS